MTVCHTFSCENSASVYVRGMSDTYLCSACIKEMVNTGIVWYSELDNCLLHSYQKHEFYYDFDRKGFASFQWVRENCFRGNNEKWYVKSFYLSCDNLDICGPIKGYHSHSENKFFSPIHSPWTVKNNLFFGLELEVLRRDAAQPINKLASQIKADFNEQFPNYVVCENDSSLKGKGFEIITQPAGLDTHAEYLKALNNKYNLYAGSLGGLHIHVDRSTISKIHLTKILTFINSTLREDLIRAVARRYNTRYCFIDTCWPALRHWSAPRIGYGMLKKHSLNHYAAVNTLNKKTIEFRLFRTSLDYNTVMACLEFVYAVVEFCRNRSIMEIIDPQSNEKFFGFLTSPTMRKQTAHLRLMFSEKKIIEAGDRKELRKIKNQNKKGKYTGPVRFGMPV